MGLKREFAKYVSFNILSMIGLSCYILADTFFIARGVGPQGLAALNLALPVFNVVSGVGLLLGMGGATRFSLLGAKRNAESAKAFTHTVYLGVFFSVLFMLLGCFFAGPVARGMGADAETFEMTNTYLKVILLFAPLFIFNHILNSFVRNDKDPRLAMAAMLTGNFVNIVLDYVFVFPLDMGIFGAVLATGISPAVGLCVLSLHMFKRKNHFYLKKQAPSAREFTACVKPGISAFIGEISNGIVIFVFNALFLRLIGNTGVTAYGIVANIALVVMAVYTGICQGIQPLVSKSCAGGEQKQAVRVYRYALLCSFAVSALVMAAALLWRGPMAAVFNEGADPVLQAAAEHGILLYFPGFFFAGVNLITAAYFAASGKSAWSFWIGFLRGIAVIIPAAVLLALLFQVDGIWLSFLAAEGIVCIVSMFLALLSRRQKI